ncbi:MAG: hypothetical protein M1318_00745 [Firmicutes bacterium]|nr:hypothetical protein [Bacillota bacterium]
MREPDIRIQVRLPKTAAQSAETAAQAEGIPVPTWIRDQVMASLYLAGVQSAPQVIYQGFRYSIQDIADNIEEIALAVRAWPELLERIMTTSMIAGGLDNSRSAEWAHQFVADALANSSWLEITQKEGDE